MTTTLVLIRLVGLIDFIWLWSLNAYKVKLSKYIVHCFMTTILVLIRLVRLIGFIRLWSLNAYMVKLSKYVIHCFVFLFIRIVFFLFIYFFEKKFSDFNWPWKGYMEEKKLKRKLGYKQKHRGTRIRVRRQVWELWW